MKRFLIGVASIILSAGALAGDNGNGGPGGVTVGCVGWGMAMDQNNQYAVNIRSQSYRTYGLSSPELIGFLDDKFLSQGKWACDISNL